VVLGSILNLHVLFCTTCVVYLFKRGTRYLSKICNLFHIIFVCKAVLDDIVLLNRCVQEIKFEPNVMCEHIDKKSTFKASQVR
jgi:hypothetical protein